MGLSVATDVSGELATGIFDGIPNHDYHRGPGISFSGMKRFSEAPVFFLEPQEESDAMILGTATHMAILEPEKFIETFTVEPDPKDHKGALVTTEDYKVCLTEMGEKFTSKMTKPELAALILAKNPHAPFWERLSKELTEGRSVLSRADYDAVVGMAESVKAHPMASRLLQNGKPEQTAYWIDPETGLLCKCRPDFLRNDGLVIDVKTTRDKATLFDFKRTSRKFKYHWQSAWYLDGLSQVMGKKLTHFVHLVIEKTPIIIPGRPVRYPIGLFVLDDESLDVARADLKPVKAQFAKCQESNDFPLYLPRIEGEREPEYTTEVQNINLFSKDW